MTYINAAGLSTTTAAKSQQPQPNPLNTKHNQGPTRNYLAPVTNTEPKHTDTDTHPHKHTDQGCGNATDY